MNPNKLREKLKAKRSPLKQSNQTAGFIVFRAGRSRLYKGLVPVSITNQGWPVYVSSEVLIGPEEIASVSPCLIVDSEVSIRFNASGVRRINGLREMDADYTLVLYINNHPVLNIALTQQVTKASEVRIPLGSPLKRDQFLEYYRASN